MLTFLSAITFRNLSVLVLGCAFFFQGNCEQAKKDSNPSKNDNKANAENSNNANSQPKNASLFCPEGSAFYVLFYANPLDTPEGKRIRDLRPNFVITPDTLYKDKAVPAFFHKDGQAPTNIRAISYITVDDDGKLVKPDIMLKQIKDSMNAGYDGVFFDEVEDETPEQGRKYYADISKAVKSFGKDKLIIFNPGEKNVEDWVFDYADIVSVENNGLNDGNEKKKKNFVKNGARFAEPFTTSSGKTFPAWRWLSVLGDPSEIAADNFDEAVMRLASFRKNNGLWFYSPPFNDDDKEEKNSSHWMLAGWLEQFAAEAKKESVKCVQ